MYVVKQIKQLFKGGNYLGAFFLELGLINGAGGIKAQSKGAAKPAPLLNT